MRVSLDVLHEELTTQHISRACILMSLDKFYVKRLLLKGIVKQYGRLLT